MQNKNSLVKTEEGEKVARVEDGNENDIKE